MVVFSLFFSFFSFFFDSDEKARLAKQKQDLASDGKDDRSQRQKHSKKVRAMKMKRLMERLHEKEQHVKEVQIKKKIEVSALRERKKIQFQKRINNVNRARREQEYRNKVAVKKLEMQWGRMEKMKQIEDAIRVQRELKKKKELIARHKWIADTKLERTITPGPGEYQATNGDMANSHANCAKWGEQNPKSEIEWVMYRAKQLPAPGDVSLVGDKCIYIFLQVEFLLTTYKSTLFFFFASSSSYSVHTI